MMSNFMKLRYLMLACLSFYIPLSFAITNGESSDFLIPKHSWSTIHAPDLIGKHEIFDIKNDKVHIFLYRVSPGGKIGIKKHDVWEEVAIVAGSLSWLDAKGKPLQVLSTGAYVDRPPHVQHGPFIAGKDGCLMYVKMHS